MKPMLLCILDGVGIREEVYGNAVKAAKMPNFNYLIDRYPHSLLTASENAVGLPKGQMGNSEVGHGTIGSGRVIYQPLERINKAIMDKSFFHNENILSVINHVKQNNSKLHILGLVSDGGIHSHIDHLLALIDMGVENEINDIYIHAFTDGRDTRPDASSSYLDRLQTVLGGSAKIATISGRYYAMDRDSRWDRIQKAYNAIVLGEGKVFNGYHEVIDDNYSKGITDEFIVPSVLCSDGAIDSNDGIIIFNFRPDRLRELARAITNPDFSEFEVKKLDNIKFLTMMNLNDDLVKYETAFDEILVTNTLGSYLSDHGLKQLRIAETEKYAHVTYFFDGGNDSEIDGCFKILIPSPKVATYDLKPEMSAFEITDVLINELDKDYLDVIILNFANGDMVGHTGDFEATVKALEAVDENLGRIISKIDEKNGTLIVTADHGNSDMMLDDYGNVVTSHSLSKVPFIINDVGVKLRDGSLADIAPTILDLLGLDKPTEMTGVSLIEKTE